MPHRGTKRNVEEKVREVTEEPKGPLDAQTIKNVDIVLPSKCIWRIVLQSEELQRGTMLTCKKGWPQEDGTIEWGPEFRKPKEATVKWLKGFLKK